MGLSGAEIKDHIAAFTELFQPRHRVIASHLEKMSRGFARTALTVFHDDMGERVIVIREPYDNPHYSEHPWYMGFSEGSRRFFMMRIKDDDLVSFRRSLGEPYDSFPSGEHFLQFVSSMVLDAHGTQPDTNGFGDHLIRTLQAQGLWEPSHQENRHVSALFDHLGRYSDPYPSASKEAVLPYESPPEHAEGGPL